MKNITWNKVKTTVKDWQVGDYIRQTSIVVIGVLITLSVVSWLLKTPRKGYSSHHVAD